MPGLQKRQLHDGWRFLAKSWPEPPNQLGYSRMEWLPAVVPGHVHLDLQQAGVIADPLAARQELGAQWVDEEDWIYELALTLDPPSRAKRVLRFDGLDTICTIWLDGEQLASHDNMFVPLEVDLSQMAVGEHRLRLEFESAPRIGRERRRRYFEQEGLAEGTVRFNERAFVRKAQYMFGWDWGPRLVSAGIWQAVSLLEYDARLLDVHVTQAHTPDGVHLSFRSETEGGGHVLHYVVGPSVSNESSNAEYVVSDGQTLRLEEPQLWWPAGMGAQPLYRVVSVLLGSAPTTSLSLPEARERALDTRELKIGLRQIELRRQQDNHGESFEFLVNGRPLWAVGANWIPDHSFPSSIHEARLRSQLLRALDMNMNMLRVWGGGLYETEDFYDLCDELGLLVWQDFPYACSYYPDGPEATAVARAEATVHVKRLRHRASLALWCGNNENLLMFESGWEGRESNPSRLYGANIYDQTLPELLRELDPGREYVNSSPAGGDSANDDRGGDQHYWDVWHGRGDWKHYRDSRGRFSSEFGFASAPGHATWKRISPEALSLEPRHALARWHDKTLKGHDTFLEYVELHYPPANNIEEWTYYSQLNQRDALRFGIEHYRRSEFCKGTLIWQLNDCWPAQSWAVLDCEGQYKAAAFELRRLYAPVLVSLDVSQSSATVWTVVDNSETEVTGEAWLEATSLLDGTVVSRWTKQVEVQPGTRTAALTCDLTSLSPTETLLTAGFGESVSHQLLGEPKDCRFAPTKLTFTPSSNGLEVHADGPVVDLFVWERDDKALLMDNFVTLPRGGRTVLRYEGKLNAIRARCLGGVCPC